MSDTNGSSLNERLALAIAEARQFAENGDVENATTKKAEADRLSKAIDVLKSMDGYTAKAAPAPTQTIPLPGTTAPAASAGFVPAEVKTAPVSNENPADLAKLAFAARFSVKASDDQLTKMVLRELNGADYEQKYYEQEQAFKSFMRFGVKPARKEVIFTPNIVKMALDQGISDMATLKATMVEAADTSAGVLVPVDFQTELISRINGLTVVRGRATQQSTSRDRVEIPRQAGGNDQYRGNVRVKWVDELPVSGVSATNMTFAMTNLFVHNTMATVAISKNVLEDSALNVESLVMNELSYAVAMDEDNQFLIGTGTGKPQGILPNGLNSLGLNEVHSGNASALTWDGLINTTFGLAAQYRKGAVWIAQRATYGAITQLKSSLSGDYFWHPYQFMGGAQGGAMPAMQLLGYPVLEQEAMPAIAANSYPLLFCDLSGYRIVDRVGMSMERYEDSVTAEQNIVKLVLRRRLGGQMVEPWRFIAHKVSV